MVTLDDFYGVNVGVTVDFACEVATPIIRCKQGDKMRPITIYPLEQGNKIVTTDDNGSVIIAPASLTPTGSVTFRLQRPDGALYTIKVPDDDVEMNWVTSAVQGKDYERVLDYMQFFLTEEMLAVAGRAVCDVQLEFYVGDKVATASFFLDIEPKPTATSSGGIDPSSFVNVKEISAADYESITPDPHTMYLIIDGQDVTLAYGSAIMSGGGYNETQVDNNISNEVWEVQS